MDTPCNTFLIIGAVLSALAALLHIGCVILGASWYRFFGAGEQMALMAEAGHWYPTVITLSIATILSVWSLYALSGAGVIRRLPLLRLVLCVITGVYLLRGILPLLFIASLPENSPTFWIVSSLICLGFGMIYLIGLRQIWSRM